MILRLFPALLLALGVSSGLFWLMQAMLQHKFEPDRRDPLTLVDFVRVQHLETAVESKPRELPPPPEPEAPAAPPPLVAPGVAPPSPAQASTPAFDLPKLGLSIAGGTIGTGVAASPGAPPSLSAPAAAPGERQLAAPDFGAALTPTVRIPPVYPLEARRKKLEGWVRVEMTVLEDGSVSDVRVKEAKPAGVFEQAAVAAVAQWKFRPATEDGKPVKRRAGQTLRFELQD